MAVQPGQTFCPRSPEKKMVDPDLLSTTMVILLSEMYFEGRFVYRQFFYYLEIHQPKFVLSYWLKAFWEQELAQRPEPQKWLRKTPRQPFITDPSGGLFSQLQPPCALHSVIQLGKNIPLNDQPRILLEERAAFMSTYKWWPWTGCKAC